jgi:hypothetical protein
LQPERWTNYFARPGVQSHMQQMQMNFSRATIFSLGKANGVTIQFTNPERILPDRTELDRIEIFKDQKLTIGVDLGDRCSQYCILNGAGEVILEGKLPTTPKGIEEVFGRIPHSRIARETGAHSP